MRQHTKLTLTNTLYSAPLGDCIRCYQCRSDEQPECGDPFLSTRIPSAECDNFYTQKTFTCFKVSTNGNSPLT